MDIPVDIYDSPQECVVIVPVGGVKKNSVALTIEWTTLVIQWERISPSIKPSLVVKSSNCYWGKFVSRVPLPANTAFDRIHSRLNPENILIIVVPKIILPESIPVEISSINEQ